MERLEEADPVTVGGYPTITPASVAAIGALPEEPVLRMTAGLATALGDIHRAGLVHRDLKPSNALLADDGPRVIGFGIARAADGEDGSELTTAGRLVGSPGFMSPEQAQGAPLDPASDIFSLGTVLVMACTGASPFTGPSMPQTLYNIVRTAPGLQRRDDERRDRERDGAEPLLGRAPQYRSGSTASTAARSSPSPADRSRAAAGSPRPLGGVPGAHGYGPRRAGPVSAARRGTVRRYGCWCGRCPCTGPR